MIADSARRRDGRELRRPVAAAAQPRVARASRTSCCSRISTTTCGRPSAARRSCCSRTCCAKVVPCTSSSMRTTRSSTSGLARHYGIHGVYGARFRKVDVTDPNRYGLFGHGSLLALTSAASRTSPIIRGKFIVTEFWNNPPPLPPGRRAGARGERAEGSAVDGARAARAAPRQPDLRGLPQQHRSGRLRARELRRRRQLARRDARGARYRLGGHPVRRHAGRRPGRAAAAPCWPIPSFSRARSQKRC